MASSSLGCNPQDVFVLYKVMYPDEAKFGKHLYMTSIPSCRLGDPQYNPLNAALRGLVRKYGEGSVSQLRPWKYTPNGTDVKDVIYETLSASLREQLDHIPHNMPIEVDGSDITIVKKGYTVRHLVDDIENIISTKFSTKVEAIQ